MPHTHPHGDPYTGRRRLVLSLALTLLFVLVELIASWYANSLALLTDAAHNFTDALALGLSTWALQQSLRPAGPRRTFGYHRTGILVALFNAATLAGLALVIGYEAVRRLAAPQPVQEQTLVLVAGIGLLLNSGIALALWRSSRNDLNLRSAFLHMAGDAVSTLGVILAGLGIALFRWYWLDPLASCIIAILVLASAWTILRETVDILLEGAPRDINLPALLDELQRVRGVLGVHDLHVWSISLHLRALSAHLLTDDVPISEGAAIQREINALLAERYGILHSTLQLEHAGCEPDSLFCDLDHPLLELDPVLVSGRQPAPSA